MSSFSSFTVLSLNLSEEAGEIGNYKNKIKSRYMNNLVNDLLQNKYRRWKFAKRKEIIPSFLPVDLDDFLPAFLIIKIQKR